MIAQGHGFPRAFATKRNTGCIAEGAGALGETWNKRGREDLVNYAG